MDSALDDNELVKYHVRVKLMCWVELAKVDTMKPDPLPWLLRKANSTPIRRHF